MVSRQYADWHDDCQEEVRGQPVGGWSPWIPRDRSGPQQIARVAHEHMGVIFDVGHRETGEGAHDDDAHAEDEADAEASSADCIVRASLGEFVIHGAEDIPVLAEAIDGI